jgi:predicted nucleic acid-binding protein
VAFHNVRDVNNGRASELMREIVAGGFGPAYTSDYVFD